ncbi:hypothetical protein LZC95_39685 [Pendulispora brunnea]|uniref:Uncharacterized protein n=1 Tax=Pendulispora brunnea TaxID=2905690 RepID=A0ABZ2K5P3_9BACT
MSSRSPAPCIFFIDVVSQYVRGKRPPGPETTLYFGLNTAYALGQVLFGLLALVVAVRAMDLLGRWPAIVLSIAAGGSWLIFGFLFLEYWEPRIAAAAYCALIVAAAVTA